MKDISQEALIKEFYIENANREIETKEAVDWLNAEYEKRTGKMFRDPDRGIRKLSQSGFLIKIKKGVYKYDPDFVRQRELEDFTQSQKEAILERDNHCCVMCGKGEKDGVELHVDHIKPKDLGGRAEIENGQTLCARHNFLKKNLQQTETGKKMFIRLYALAQKSGDNSIIDFCRDILEVYERHDINGHIEWEK